MASKAPDLNPCELFLCGYLEARFYNPMPKILDDLRITIEREINLISKETLKKVFLNFEKSAI